MTEIGFRPNLRPDGPPQLHDNINPCICGALDEHIPVSGISFETTTGHKYSGGNGTMHVTSVMVVQDKEGWYSVICTECGRESSLKSSSMNGAIKIWNEETPTK